MRVFITRLLRNLCVLPAKGVLDNYRVRKPIAICQYIRNAFDSALVSGYWQWHINDRQARVD
jgi:hypothetical protein